MKTNKVHLVSLLAIAHLSAATLLADSGPGDVDFIMAVCKDRCPSARTPAETHECVEQKAQTQKSIRQSKCWEENKRYEKVIESVKTLKK